MQSFDKETYNDNDHLQVDNLAHAEYFKQFSEVIEKRFVPNEEIVRYRTCQESPCSEEDSQANMFRKKNGQVPPVQLYAKEELYEMDEEEKYSLVTKGALSFNTSTEAARSSAVKEFLRIRKEKQGKTKALKYRKKRGELVLKFKFPKGSVLISPTSPDHDNILLPSGVNIEMFRDTSFEEFVNYDNYATDE